ncbi:MAG: polysaccharide biosynthesis protein [Clostridia bacterium]|nr:polysaccharide biosynthesis protein [Clostridia bacterium]
MKIQRTKNAVRNIAFDGSVKLFNMVIPFIMRTVILHCLGVEYLGLNGLFVSILSFLSLAELGVGSAMVFSMYKPIAEDDTDTICALLRLYRTFYRIIGLFIAVAGLALLPFLKNLIKGDIPPDLNLYVLYLMNLGCTVLTYWLFAYRNSLFQAHQRRDVSSKVKLAVSFVEYGLKIVALAVFHSYYMYLTVQLLSQVAANLLVYYQSTRMYPQYTPRGTLPKEKVLDIARRVRDLFTSKFSYTIFNSADTLVISSFLGLTVLAVYQNYFYIITSLRTMLEVVTGACIAGVGNSLVTESGEKNYRDLERFTMMFGWLMVVSTAMLLCMYQPFMFLWMGQERMLTFNYVICFAIYFYTMGINKLINMFKDAAGIWRKDRWRPLTAALVNLGLNLATVQRLGLYGVLLSSVVSIVAVQIPWLFHNLFQEVFPHKYLWRYARYFCGFVAVALVSCGASLLACSLLHLAPWPTLIVNACFSFLIPNALMFLIYGRSSIFMESVNQFKWLLNGMLHKRKPS